MNLHRAVSLNAVAGKVAVQPNVGLTAYMIRVWRPRVRRNCALSLYLALNLREGSSILIRNNRNEVHKRRSAENGPLMSSNIVRKLKYIDRYLAILKVVVTLSLLSCTLASLRSYLSASSFSVLRGYWDSLVVACE